MAASSLEAPANQHDHIADLSIETAHREIDSVLRGRHRDAIQANPPSFSNAVNNQEAYMANFPSIGPNGNSQTQDVNDNIIASNYLKQITNSGKITGNKAE